MTIHEPHLILCYFGNNPKNKTEKLQNIYPQNVLVVYVYIQKLNPRVRFQTNVYIADLIILFWSSLFL